MDTDNPYKSPETPAVGVDSVPTTRRPPVVLSGLLVFVGVLFLLLLNGQVFTNTLVFLGLCTASSLLWIPLVIPSPRNEHRRLAFYVILGHAFVIIAVATGLREKYQWQNSFNTRLERLHDQSTTTPGD